MTSLDFLYVALGASALAVAAAASFALVQASLLFKDLRGALLSVAEDLPAAVRSLRATLEELEAAAGGISAFVRTVTGFASWLRELGGFLSFVKNLFRRRS